MISVLVLLGQVLELRARSRTNTAIKLLLGLAPNTARIVRAEGAEEDIPWIRSRLATCFAYDRVRRRRWMA